MRYLYAAAILLALCFAPRAARAQTSAYVPLDDISYSYVDALMARGFLSGLSILERPYSVGAISSALDSARATSPDPVIVSFMDALSGAIAKYGVPHRETDSTLIIRSRFSGNVFATGQTSGRRELMLSDLKRTARPGASIKLVSAAGPLASSVRVLIDNRLNTDPEFSGRKDRRIAARTEDGYLRGEWPYAEFSIGRVARNAAAPGLTGLQLGDYAYTYDHLFARIGNDALHWSSVLARLDGDQLKSGTVIDRYFSLHRLALRRSRWEIAGSESFVYTGAGRGFEPSLSNPFNIFALSWRNEKADGNLGLGLDGAYRSTRFGTLAAQLFLDDLQIDKCDTICHEPSSYAASASLTGIPFIADQRAFASYIRVSNLAYRTPNPAERYAVLGIGLGAGFSDYDEARAGVDLALIPATPVKLYAAFRRQGEGDYRKAYPLVAAYTSTPGFLSGAVMRVTRLAASGATRRRQIEASADVGFNHVTNHAHIAGASRSGFEGRVRLSWEPRFSASF